MVLGVRKRRHCERGEKRPDSASCDAATQVALHPYGGVCSYLGSDLDIVEAVTPAALMEKRGCKILRMICGREVKQAVCDVKLGSLFPWFVQIRMSHFQHYRVCWDSTFVSTNHVEIMLILSVEALF